MAKYKIIHNGTIIDAIENPTFFKVVSSAKRIIVTDKSNADGIIGTNKVKYILQGHRAPEGSSYKIVKIESIADEDYVECKELLKKGSSITQDVTLLTKVREEKISELSERCNNTIVRGVNIILSDGLYHHFKLTLEDQLNLSEIQANIDNYGKYILYHETGKICKKYSRKDMKTILKETAAFKMKHTTYFNLMKYCINNMRNTEEIRAISYGDNLLSLNVSSRVKLMIQEILNG